MSCRSAAASRLGVERLRLTISQPSSTAQRRPASSADGPSREPGPSTRTLHSSQAGATERMIPAHAVPWPATSPSASAATTGSPPGVLSTATARWRPPTSSWSPSTPLSRTATRTPAPSAPPHAHSRSIGCGRRRGRPRARGSSRRRLQAGSPSSRVSARSPAAVGSLAMPTPSPSMADSIPRRPGCPRAGGSARGRRGGPDGPGRGGPEGPERLGGALIAGADQLGPAAAVEEQVIQPRAAAQARVGGVDDRERVAELALGPAGELDVVGLLELAAGAHDPHRLLLPAGDVVGLEPLREHEVDPEYVVERAILDRRLGREQLDQPAVDVQVD